MSKKELDQLKMSPSMSCTMLPAFWHLPRQHRQQWVCRYVFVEFPLPFHKHLVPCWYWTRYILSEGNLPTRFFCFLPDNDIGFDFEFFQGHDGYALRWRDEEKEERVGELYQQISTHVFLAPTFTTPPASRSPESWHKRSSPIGHLVSNLMVRCYPGLLLH